MGKILKILEFPVKNKRNDKSPKQEVVNATMLFHWRLNIFKGNIVEPVFPSGASGKLKCMNHALLYRGNR